jgi:hypothetical protein
MQNERPRRRLSSPSPLPPPPPYYMFANPPYNASDDTAVSPPSPSTISFPPISLSPISSPPIFPPSISPPPISPPSISPPSISPPPISPSPASPPPQDPIAQFRRYMIEIMGFTFCADFQLLNDALGQPSISLSFDSSPTTTTTSSPATSILTPAERAELLRLALLLPFFTTKLERNQWITVRDADRNAVVNAIIKPAIRLGLTPEGIMRLLNSYATHQCKESERRHTLISRQTPCLMPLIRLFSFLGPFNLWLLCLGIELNYHAHIIASAAPSEEVRLLLGTAMQVYQEKRLGLDKVTYPEGGMSVGYYPWRKLTRVLITLKKEVKLELEHERAPRPDVLLAFESL